MFGLPLAAEGSLHGRRRPAPRGELIAVTCQDDIGFAATGSADIIVAVVPAQSMEQWMQMIDLLAISGEVDSIKDYGRSTD